ncbi:MAG: DUF1080 domain-containing protein [bacterium]
MKNSMAGRITALGVAMLIAGCSGLLFAEESVGKFMGDWQGTAKNDGKEVAVVAQVIALGDGKYEAHILDSFVVKVRPRSVLQGALAGEKITFGEAAAIEGGKFTGKIQDLGAVEMTRVERTSPTLGAKPPDGAVVLFDGSTLDGWQRVNGQACEWKLLDGGIMEVVPGKGSIVSKKKFTDHKIHIEFRLPFQPKARGQGRGNSGVYVQNHYEVQVLDSYGLEGKDDECGGIYKVGSPKVNMCYPPMQWQTYDITFKAPRFDKGGKKTTDAVMTVVHNGFEIHKDLVIPHPTVASEGGDVKPPNGLYLQDHGNPVQFMNIWVVETKE